MVSFGVLPIRLTDLLSYPPFIDIVTAFPVLEELFICFIWRHSYYNGPEPTIKQLRSINFRLPKLKSLALQSSNKKNDESGCWHREILVICPFIRHLKFKTNGASETETWRKISRDNCLRPTLSRLTTLPIGASCVWHPIKLLPLVSKACPNLVDLSISPIGSDSDYKRLRHRDRGGSDRRRR